MDGTEEGVTPERLAKSKNRFTGNSYATRTIGWGGLKQMCKWERLSLSSTQNGISQGKDIRLIHQTILVDVRKDIQLRVEQRLVVKMIQEPGQIEDCNLAVFVQVA